LNNDTFARAFSLLRAFCFRKPLFPKNFLFSPFSPVQILVAAGRAEALREKIFAGMRGAGAWHCKRSSFYAHFVLFRGYSLGLACRLASFQFYLPGVFICESTRVGKRLKKKLAKIRN
jgi:hypothetical protein